VFVQRKWRHPTTSIQLCFLCFFQRTMTLADCGRKRCGQGRAERQSQSAIASPITTGSITPSLSVSARETCLTMIYGRSRERRLFMEYGAQVHGLKSTATLCNLSKERFFRPEDDWLFPISYIIPRTSPQCHFPVSMQTAVGRSRQS
jgi:hypothetical protein